LGNLIIIKEKGLPNKNMKVKLVVCLLIVMLQLPSRNNYHHATTIIMRISSWANLKENPQLLVDLQ